MRGRDQGLTGRLSARLRANLTMKTGRLSTRLLALPDTVCGCIHPGRSGSQLGSRQLTKIAEAETRTPKFCHRPSLWWSERRAAQSFQGFCSPVRNQNTSLTPNWICLLPPDPTTGFDAATSGVYAGTITFSCALQIRAQAGEVRMIENIENLRSELRLQALIDGERFRKGHIYVAVSRTAHRIAPHIPERSPLCRNQYSSVLSKATAPVVRGCRIISARIDARKQSWCIGSAGLRPLGRHVPVIVVFRDKRDSDSIPTSDCSHSHTYSNDRCPCRRR